MIDDRDRRIVRSRARLAVAIEAIERATFDAGAVDERLDRVLRRNARSLRWVARELARQEGRADRD